MINSIYLTIISLALTQVPAALACGDGEAHADTTSLSHTEKAVLKVGKMKCSSCSKNIEAALRKVNGVKEVRVDHKNNQAVVYYVKAQTQPSALVDAVKAAHYDAALVE